MREVTDRNGTMVITQHSEAKSVLENVTTSGQGQESLALLKMLAQCTRSLQEDRSKPPKRPFADVRKRIKVQPE